jgi:hypothetical protein
MFQLQTCFQKSRIKEIFKTSNKNQIPGIRQLLMIIYHAVELTTPRPESKVVGRKAIQVTGSYNY